MSATTHTLNVEGIGAFTFRRRRMREQFAISAEFSRLTEGVEKPSEELAVSATVVATLKALTIAAPEGWDIDEMDPLDPETYGRLTTVYTELTRREEFFRTGGGPKREADGQGDQSGP